MGVPKRKNSKARRDKRRANKGLDFGSIGRCQTCQNSVAPHSACTSCGYYKGVKVLRTKSDRMHERGQKRNQTEAKVPSKFADKQANTHEESIKKSK